jgi:two-component system, cell cycle response regulator
MGCVRPYDTLGRYGGEEFLIVAPSLDGSGALGLAERIRQAIESEPVSTSSGEVRVTASFGVAVSDHAKPLESDALLHLADEALYRAKDHGRNRSELSTDPELVKPGGG